MNRRPHRDRLDAGAAGPGHRDWQNSLAVNSSCQWPEGREGQPERPAPANQTVTILYKMLYNSYNIVTSYQFVQSVQSVQLHLLILYKRFHKMLYNSSEKVLN